MSSFINFIDVALFLCSLCDVMKGQFLLALCVELATEGKPDSSRQLAGLYIKNLITASVSQPDCASIIVSQS